MAIDYQVLVDEAMLGIVKKILVHAQDNGLKDDQRFYISFHTNYSKVILSKNVKARYPKEITIVLQYQYENLQVLEDRFSVDIEFSGISEAIEVPFSALTGFAEPSVNFSLQFRQVAQSNKSHIHETTHLLKMRPKQKEALKKEAGEVVSIEQFRNKSK
jgi:hypothetical protein